MKKTFLLLAALMATTVVHAVDVTFYVKSTAQPYLYLYYNDGNELNGNWDSCQMTETITTSDGLSWWKQTVDIDFANVTDPVTVMLHDSYGHQTGNTNTLYRLAEAGRQEIYLEWNGENDIVEVTRRYRAKLGLPFKLGSEELLNNPDHDSGRYYYCYFYDRQQHYDGNLKAYAYTSSLQPVTAPWPGDDAHHTYPQRIEIRDYNDATLECGFKVWRFDQRPDRIIFHGSNFKSMSFPFVENGVYTYDGVGNVVVEGNLPINADNFPDEVFRSYIANKYDSDHDGNLSVYERTYYPNSQFHFSATPGVASVVGCEHLFGVNDICFYECNSFAEPLLLALPELYSIDVRMDFPAIDVSDCSMMRHIWTCDSWDHTPFEFDLSANLLIDEFYISNLNITLPVTLPSPCTYLRNLILRDCVLPDNTLDVSTSTLLENLECGECQLTEIVLPTPADKLKMLNCNQNYLTGTLDLTTATALEQLYCSNNQLTAVNVNSPVLNICHMGNNQVPSVDFTTARASLNELYAPFNLLSGTLDLSNFTALTRLEVYKNSLEEVRLTGDNNLKHLNASFNNLTSLDTRTCTRLERIAVQHNNITNDELLVNKPSLCGLYIGNNQLSGEFDVSDYTRLHYLWVNDNNINELTLDPSDKVFVDIEANGYNWSFDDVDNDYSEHSVGIDKMGLVTLVCDHNKLRSLDLSKQPNLMFISVSYNELSHLDLMAQSQAKMGTGGYLDMINLYREMFGPEWYLELGVNFESEEEALYYIGAEFEVDLGPMVNMSFGDMSHNRRTFVADRTDYGGVIYSYIRLDNTGVTRDGLRIGNEHGNINTDYYLGEDFDYTRVVDGSWNHASVLETEAVGRILLLDDSYDEVTYTYPTDYSGTPESWVELPATPLDTGEFGFYWTASNVVTAIALPEVAGVKPTSVKYVSAMGIVSDHPHDGLNIVVTTYDDGTIINRKALY